MFAKDNAISPRAITILLLTVASLDVSRSLKSRWRCDSQKFLLTQRSLPKAMIEIVLRRESWAKSTR
jgi:hypothetical protein